MVLQWMQYFDLQYLHPKLEADQNRPHQNMTASASTQTSPSVTPPKLGTGDMSPKRRVKHITAKTTEQGIGPPRSSKAELEISGHEITLFTMDRIGELLYI